VVAMTGKGRSGVPHYVRGDQCECCRRTLISEISRQRGVCALCDNYDDRNLKGYRLAKKKGTLNSWDKKMKGNLEVSTCGFKSNKS